MRAGTVDRSPVITSCGIDEDDGISRIDLAEYLGAVAHDDHDAGNIAS